jgi:hypothetical protein
VIGVIERDLPAEKERVRWQVMVRLGFFIFLERGLAFPSEGEGPRPRGPTSGNWSRMDGCSSSLSSRMDIEGLGMRPNIVGRKRGRGG